MIVQTPTPNIEQSIDFYTRLKFTRPAQTTPTLVTDGQVIIEINPDRYARPGIRLYSDSWDQIVPGLRKQTKVIDIKDGHLLSDPSGTKIYLSNSAPPVALTDIKAPPSILGNYAGLSLEVVDIHQAAELWALLGFTPNMGSADQGWMTLQNSDKESISLMKPNACPHLFFNPSLTYFNGKNNLTVIQNVRDAGILITEEITFFNKEGIVDNIILRDPGGYGFFIFSD